MPDEISVTHDAPAHRFVATLEGHEATLMYRLTGATIELYHTYVPEAFRGKGIAEKLAKAAFEHAKANHLTVIPSCSYISGGYLKRHPEYQPLVHGHS